MMTFIWKDRAGVEHRLTHYQPMFDEKEQIEQEVDDLLPHLDSPDVQGRDLARRAIKKRLDRLHIIRDDIMRWNALAVEDARHTASEMLADIRGLRERFAPVCLVASLNDEHMQLFIDTLDQPDDRKAMLTGMPTQAQSQAMLEATDDDAPPAYATRAQAWAWITHQPQFQRQWTDTDGWFVWTDLEGHIHRLADPLRIERAFVATIAELESMREDLSHFENPDALSKAVEVAVACFDRLASLKADLARFTSEAEARDLAECNTFSKNWRKRRDPS